MNKSHGRPFLFVCPCLLARTFHSAKPCSAHSCYCYNMALPEAAVEAICHGAWHFLDGYSFLAWLATCKTVRSSPGSLEKARDAKRMFQEVDRYLKSGKILLPGMSRRRSVRVEISLLPLNPWRPDSRNWNTFEEFCQGKPMLSEILFAELTYLCHPWWCQFEIKDHVEGEDWPPFHEELLRIVDRQRAAYAPSLHIMCSCGRCSQQRRLGAALFYTGWAFGNFRCAILAQETF